MRHLASILGVFGAVTLIAIAAPVPSKVQRFREGEERAFEISNELKIKFCWIPEGTAKLGSPSDEHCRGSDEDEHDYRCAGFWMSKYPITQEEWEAQMKENPSHFVPKLEDTFSSGKCPVEMVSWHDACKFVASLNSKKGQEKLFESKGTFRLPTEHEWEYACRGGRGNRKPYYWGNSLNGTEANCNGTDPYGTKEEGSFIKRTSEVGAYQRKSPHPWGLCDMLGNVWQWCNDKRLDDRGEKIGAIRGGSWTSGASACRAANRATRDFDSKLNFIGFRIAFIPD